MAWYLKPIRAVFLCFVCVNIIPIQANFCKNKEEYVIRSAGSNGLVLDAGDLNHVTVQYYTASSYQRWRIECGTFPGRFYIYNVKTGTPLGIVLRDNGYDVVVSQTGVLEQEWYLNSNERISSAFNKWNIDVHNQQFVPGNRVKLWSDNGSIAQKFVFQKIAYVA